MDSFLRKLRELMPCSPGHRNEAPAVTKQILFQVAKTVDPSLWNDEKIEFLFHSLPDVVPLDDLALLLYDPINVKAMPCAAQRVDPIAKEAATAVLEAEPRQFQNTSDAEEHLDLNESAWQRLHGEMLEPALEVNTEYGHSPVRLIDARFLIELHKRSGKLHRRQDLPDGAFLSPEAIKRMSSTWIIGSETLRIASVSHPWQQPDHPDPQSLNLGILSDLLQILLRSVRGTFAVFIDFACLFQKGPNAEERSKMEHVLFKQALSNMMHWYSHPHLVTLKLSKMPEGYPVGFDFPKGVTPNTADYSGRGWCFCESSVSNMVKSSHLVFDLGKLSGEHRRLHEVWDECKAGREPPLSPDDFRVQLAKKSFTSKQADEATVADLYEDTFKVRMGQVETLHYSNLGWGAPDMAVLSRTLKTVAMPACRQLFLGGNVIGDQGMQWLSEALGTGALPSCHELSLERNTIGDEGVRWISENFGTGALPMCKSLSLHDNQIGDDGLHWLTDALDKGALPVCHIFHIYGNRISNCGRRLFEETFERAGRSGLRMPPRCSLLERTLHDVISKSIM